MDLETQEIRQARHRASVKWLISKAFNNRVPDNLKEPFYRDHENQERLKPQIIVEMGNATLYCQTLSNLYSDPNYESLNHWSILQTLARKGVPAAESPDTPLTETVLRQTNPLKINAHMAVIESLMILYAKEIMAGERVLNAIQRISGSNYQPPAGQSFEHTLLTWVSHVCASLKKRITKEIELGATDENGVRLQTPDIPPVRDFQNLCDGICLALLVSYYCPNALPWTRVRINYLPTVEDSIHNILLISDFSQKHLPYNVFHMTPEDVTYTRGSMKLNLIVLLSDLFNLVEIHPAKCVNYPEKEQGAISKCKLAANEHGIVHRRGLTKQPVTPIPDLRSDLDTPSGSPTQRLPHPVAMRVTPIANKYSTEHETNNFKTSHNEGFVVHKSRGITTLSSMHSQQEQHHEPLFPARLRQSKEKSSIDARDEKDYAPAGRPSNWEQNRRSSFAGRRSRRNSSSEDSQLTIENFGGSQDQLNTIGQFERERDRERERERKLSSASAEPAVAVRSSIADARGTLQLGYDTDSGSEKQDRETEKYSLHHESSANNLGRPMPPTQKQHSISKDNDDAYDYDTIAMGKFSQSEVPAQSSRWQNSLNDPYDDDAKSVDNASKLSTIRMKLEEKRRRIEEDKLKVEMALLRHQEKTKLMQSYQQKDSSFGIEQGGGNGGSGGDNKSELVEGNQVDAIETASVASGSSSLGDKPITLLQLQQQQEALKSELQKWDNFGHDSKGIDPTDMEKYQQSIAIMNMNLQDIQQDIQRLATQQNQIQAQHLQAQQLMQAQQIANMLNQQQTYGSQQHLADHPQQRQSFGSTPHLPKAFNTPMNANVYNSRPPSRDPYLNMQQPPPPNHPIQYINEHGQYMQQTQPSMMQMQNMYCDNAGPYNNYGYGMPQYGGPSPSQQYMSRYDDYTPPHLMRDHNSPQPNQYYMNESSPQPPQPTQRRTWTPSPYDQRQPPPMVDVNAWQSAKKGPLPGENMTWEMQPSFRQGYSMHQNGSNDLFPVHSSPQQTQYNADDGGGGGGGSGIRMQQQMPNMRDNRASNSFNKIPTSVPPLAADDMMAPQSICFIGDEEDVEEIERDIIQSMQGAHISDYTFNQAPKTNYSSRNSSEGYDSNEPISQKLNITSGNLTYRIPSPSRPLLHAKSFQDPREENTNEKGFYISFDDEQPKRPKPPLRPKRSPKKDKGLDCLDHQVVTKEEILNKMHENVVNLHEYRDVHNDNGINNTENKSATYNKHTDPPIQLRQLTSVESMNTNNHTNYDRRHLEDVTNQQQSQPMQPLSPTHQQLSSQAAHRQNSLHYNNNNNNNNESKSKALVIGTDVTNLDPESVDEMERRKEKIMLLSLQRRQQQEEAKARKEIEAAQKREREREKEEERTRKKEEQVARRAAILEQHRLKKAMEEAEREGKPLDRAELNAKQPSQAASGTLRLRQQRAMRPRPKTIHVDDGSMEISEASSVSSRSKKGSSTNLTGYGQLSSNSIRRDYYRGSQDSINVKESPDEYPSTSSTPIGRRGSYKTSRAPTVERGRTLSRISVAKGSTLNFRGRKSNSLMNLCDTDSGLGRATPPRRAPSPGMGALGKNMSSASGPGSLPPGLISKRRGFDDGSSDISTPNSMMEYSGPKLYKQPAAKSNRGIILNAVEYCVFPGAVNRDAKQKVLEKIARSEAKHFLILFRDAGCQFRALYSYVPETDQVSKLYGTGPSQVDEIMFDKFFKYNSGGKCFSQVHTKHLTVTIDAFTIHNSLWQGKKVHLPSKKDMALVI